MLNYFLFYLSDFPVSFLCSGKKGGEIDMTFSLNYTSLVETDDTKTFVIVVRRVCLQTGMHGGYYYNATFCNRCGHKIAF